MSKLRSKIITLLAVLLCAMLLLSTVFLIPRNKTARATAVSSSNTIGDLVASASASGVNFNDTNLKSLINNLTGKRGNTYDQLVNTLFSGSKQTYNGKDLQKLAAGNLSGSALTEYNVQFYNKQWIPTYLSKDEDGNIILTLWLAQNEDNALTSTERTEWTGQSSRNNNIVQSNSEMPYPTSMYSTSKIRSALMGTQYSTSITALCTEAEGQETQRDVWKNFNTYCSSYVVTPGKVKWQLEQDAAASLYNNYSHSYSDCWPNEASARVTTNLDKWPSDTTGSNVWFQDKPDYFNWATDTLWIPSFTELGDIRTSDGFYNNADWFTGIWDLTANQLKNIMYTWSRSGGGHNHGNVQFINSNGAYDVSATPHSNKYGIRPAFHLNLTKISQILDSPTDVSNHYNGETQTLEDLAVKPAWYNEKIYSNKDIISVEYLGDMLEVSKDDGYTVKVTTLDPKNYPWKDAQNESDTVRYFKYKITQAPLKISTLKVDENGNLDGEGSSINEIINSMYLTTYPFERDVGTSRAPQFGLQYKRVNGGSWTSILPEAAGQYYARAYITNANNSYYYLESDGQTTFTKPKEYVATPHFTQDGLDASQIVGTTLTVQYTGEYQNFKLVNTLDDKLVGVTIGERTGGLSYDQKTGTFRAKSVGVYTVEALLEDGGASTQWDTDATSVSKTITLIITKAELKVNILESDMTSWTKGDIDYITVEVSKVRNNENVKLDVYYMTSGSSAKTYVADSAMTLDEDTGVITVIVNLATFDTNKEYQLFVALRENIAANDNYTLINNSAPFTFFIMTATINDEDVVGAWTISNLISGTKEAEDRIEVDYNGSAYTLALDESKLPKGFDFKYTNESYTDVKDDGGYYTTRVMLTCQAGYQLASGKSSLSFEISWKINPIEFDVAYLEWADNPEWDDTDKIMSIINLPAWLEGNVEGSWGVNSGRAVGSYNAVYVLMSDGNYVFTYSGEDNENNIIEYDGAQATLKHVWEITKKIINVTNAPKQWTTELVEYSTGESNYIYKIYVPAGLDLRLIKVTYYSNADLSEGSKIADIRKLTVDPEHGTTYYIKIEIDDDSKKTYVMYNTLTKGDYASTSFVVGGGQEIIEVTYESSDELMYNGQPQNITAKYSGLDFTYTYYKMGDNSALDGAPTDVGEYRVVVETSDDHYWIQNSVFYFTITPLVLTTNGYKPATGNQLKETNVIADGVADTSQYFKYEVYDKNGKVDSGNLKYNTTYTVKLVITNENVIWSDDAVTSYIFTTSFDPNAETQYLDDPAITVTDESGKTVKGDSVVWTGEEFTVTINNWSSIRQYLTATVDGADELTIDENGIFKVSAVGFYTITLTLTEEAVNAGAAEWLWSTGSLEKTVTFEITKRYVAIPVANGEVGYNGEEQYLFPEGFEEQYVKVNDGAVLSATEIGGEWRVKLWLKDKENTCWADGTTDDLTFTWSIVKASIKGKWEIHDGYAQFIPDDEAHADKFTTTYYDEDGNEVAVEDMVEGKKYTAKIAVKDEYEENYGLADGVTDEYSFTYGESSSDDPNGEDEGDLAQKKEDAKKDLEDVAQKKKDEIDSDPDMTDEEKEEAKKKVDDELQKGKDAIDSATSSSGVDSAFNQSKKNIENIGLKDDSGSFPWWIIAVIGAALLLLALLIIIIVKRRQAADGEDDYDDYYDDEYDYDEEEYEEDDFGDEY